MLNAQKILTLLFICTLLSVALLVSGCADTTDITEEASNGQSGTHTDPESVSIDDTTDIKWHWSALTGDDAGNLSTAPDPQRYTIQFSKDGTYGIRADCNSGGGEYALAGDKLTIEPGFTTLVYCGPESLDTRYLSLLQAVTGFSVADEKLVLSLEEEGKQMIFVKESPATAEDILDIKWQWTGIVEASEDTTSQTAVPEPENYTIIFQADERYSIKADCNVGSGEYSIKGNNLTVSTPSLTRAYCGPDSMDMMYLSMLSNVTAFSLENGRLVLSLGGSGDEMIFDKGKESRP